MFNSQNECHQRCVINRYRVVLHYTPNAHTHTYSYFTYNTYICTNTHIHTNMWIHIAPNSIHRFMKNECTHSVYADYIFGHSCRGVHAVLAQEVVTHTIMHNHRRGDPHTQTHTIRRTYATYLEKTQFSDSCRQQPFGFSPSLTVCQDGLVLQLLARTE